MLEITTPAPPGAMTSPEFVQHQRGAEQVDGEDRFGRRLRRGESGSVRKLRDVA